MEWHTSRIFKFSQERLRHGGGRGWGGGCLIKEIQDSGASLKVAHCKHSPEDWPWVKSHEALDFPSFTLRVFLFQNEVLPVRHFPVWTASPRTWEGRMIASHKLWISSPFCHCALTVFSVPLGSQGHAFSNMIWISGLEERDLPLYICNIYI